MSPKKTCLQNLYIKQNCDWLNPHLKCFNKLKLWSKTQPRWKMIEIKAKLCPQVRMIHQGSGDKQTHWLLINQCVAAMMHGCPTAWNNTNDRHRSRLILFIALVSSTNSCYQLSPKICTSAKTLTIFLVQREAVRAMETLELSYKCNERWGLNFLTIKEGALDRKKWTNR